MVGWSRRSRESSERRERFDKWWATLTEEEKEKYRIKQKEVQKSENRIVLCFIIICMIVISLAWWCK